MKINESDDNVLNVDLTAVEVELLMLLLGRVHHEQSDLIVTVARSMYDQFEEQGFSEPPGIRSSVVNPLIVFESS